MKIIVLGCPCGGTASFTDARGSFIRGGGEPDEQGRVYLIEKWASEWKQEHAGHRAARGNGVERKDER